MQEFFWFRATSLEEDSGAILVGEAARVYELKKRSSMSFR